MAKGKEIIRGMPASPGVVVATVRIVDKDKEKMAKLSKGEVMVAERTTPEEELYMSKAAAIVTDVGGVTSHTAIVAREFGIPAIVGTAEGTTTLQDGQKVVVDAKEGVVYEYVEEAPAKPGALASKMEELAAKKGIHIPPEILKRLAKGE